MADTELQQLAKTDRNPVQETRYQQLLKEQGATGTAGIGSTPSVSDFLTQWQQGQATANTQAANTENDFLNRFRGAIGAQETIPAMATRIGTELGLPALQASSNQLNTTLSGIPAVQTAATRGYDVNENQRQRIIAAEQAKIAPEAVAANTQTQNAQQMLSQQLGYGVQQNALALQPYQTEAGMISDRVAREVSGYTQGMQNELTILLQKMANDQALSIAETQRAQQLADQEAAFEQQKEIIKLQTDEAIRQSQALKTGTGGGGANILQYLGGTPATQPTALQPTPSFQPYGTTPSNSATLR